MADHHRECQEWPSHGCLSCNCAALELRDRDAHAADLLARLRAAEAERDAARKALDAIPCSTCDGAGTSKGRGMSCPDCKRTGRGTWQEWKERFVEAEKEREDAKQLAQARLLELGQMQEELWSVEMERNRAVKERDQARERESYALDAIERNDERHAEALRAVRQRAERAEQTRDAHAEALAQTTREAWEAADRIAALTVERDEARAALIRSQEDHRAAVEALETYEERIGDIADHVLGLVPPDTPSIVKLDAIERRCGEERVAARRAESRAREMEAEHRAAEARVRELEATVQGMALRESDLKEELTDENAALRAVAARLGEWTHEFGAALKPKCADTFGEGVRECKAQVESILAALPGGRDRG